MTAIAEGPTLPERYMLRALEIAHGEIGVREVTRNRGPRIDEYLRSVELDPTRGSYPWCAAFVYWCLLQAADEFRIICPAPKTAGAIKSFALAPTAAKILPATPDRIRPGCTIAWDHGHGKGHVGFVLGVNFETRMLTTIEGNTDDGGSREGDGVYMRERRLDDPRIIGFVDYGKLSGLRQKRLVE